GAGVDHRRVALTRRADRGVDAARALRAAGDHHAARDALPRSAARAGEVGAAAVRPAGIRPVRAGIAGAAVRAIGAAGVERRADVDVAELAGVAAAAGVGRAGARVGHAGV